MTVTMLLQVSRSVACNLVSRLHGNNCVGMWKNILPFQSDTVIYIYTGRRGVHVSHSYSQCTTVCMVAQARMCHGVAP